MSLLSSFKKEENLKCDWCEKEMKSPAYVKFIGEKKYKFCSQLCKKNFRKYSGKSKIASCPACALRR